MPRRFPLVRSERTNPRLRSVGCYFFLSPRLQLLLLARLSIFFRFPSTKSFERMSFVVKAVGILQQPSSNAAALLWYIALRSIRHSLFHSFIQAWNTRSKHGDPQRQSVDRRQETDRAIDFFLRSVSRRLKSVKSIQKITKSMKMVSAAKFAKAEKELRAARPYGASAKGNSRSRMEKEKETRVRLFV